MAGDARTATVRVWNVPYTAVAREFATFFESAVGPVHACKISTHRANWKPKGHARLQFDSLASAHLALHLSHRGLLPLFQGARLSLSPSFDDVDPRAADPNNRVRRALLHVGYLSEEQWMEVLASWDEVAVDVMPEKERVNLLVEDGGEMYRLEIMFRDVVATFGCSLVGAESNAVLLKLKYAPRIYQRMCKSKSGTTGGANRYLFCKEAVQYLWVRTTDFSKSYSIGQSDYFCMELPDGFAPEQITGLPFYKNLGDLTITEGVPLGSPPGVVPIIDCPSEYAVPYEILFQLNSLVHAQKISYGQVNSDLFSTLSSLSIDTAKRILLKLQKIKSTSFEPVKFIREQLDKMRRNPKNNILSDESLLAKNLMSCHRILVTPSRVYFLGPEVETSNHVVKYHAAHASDFVRVSFVEEDWSKVPADAISIRLEHNIFSEPYRTKIYERILSILSKGISIGPKRFEFLAFSASQLRGNSVWMFASGETITAESIREWMGNFNKILSVSKCAARMGQLFSSSMQTLDVHPHDVHTIEDIEVTTDGIKYCFSDGIGKISATFASQVAEKCGLRKIPSAFQIRYGGYKGVVAVDCSSVHKLSLRPSMLKFESSNTMLNITKWSESMPCYLNREIICLLSTLGVEDAHFEALQQEHLQLLGEVLTNRESALRFLDSMPGGDKKTALKMLNTGFEPDKEPYLLMMLKAYSECHLSDIRSKCRIFVPKGRVLIGCLDETGSLSYGEVYMKVTLTETELKCQKQTYFEIAEDQKTATVVGPLIVTKNPCLHPGDIRVLQAVKDPRLEEEGFLDCIVFPQKGHRPHPNECSGGDLDGDLYFICWDKNFIPCSMETPMDYIGRRPRNMDHEVTIPEIHKFFVEYMIHDSLGAISTSHLVHADCEPDKARSPKCLQLANLHSMAVDFAKTGAPADMPKVLKPKKYPDFMERTDRPRYISAGVLGKLYRAMIEWIEEQNFHVKWLQSIEVAYDPDLEAEGFQSFIEDAKDYKRQYAERLGALMNYYGAVTEVEILTGNLRSRSTYLERDKKKYTELKDRILVGVKSLQREVATEWFKGRCTESNFPKLVSACYHVTYHPTHRSSTSFLSFPWIFCDTLLHIKSVKVFSRR